MIPRTAIFEQRPAALLLFVFVIAFIALFPGIGELTGITGKDEYLLTMRTPMHMIEGGHGWLPWLDGEPRLKKPPLLYWIGKLSYEWFGFSLYSARAIGVLFASILVTVSAALAWLLFRHTQQALFAGLVTLGMAGIMIDGRRYLLDIPVAALSALSVCLLLAWEMKRSSVLLVLSMLSLSMAFLAKGPVSLIFYFTAFTAWFLIRHEYTKNDFDWKAWLISFLLPVSLVMAWYLYVYQLFPEKLVDALHEEASGREAFRFSLDPLLNLIVIALPWSLVAFYLVKQTYYPATESDIDRKKFTFLVLWLTLSLLPFFFFKTFSRYMYGLLVPLALIVSQLAYTSVELKNAKYWLRTGAALTLMIGIALILFVAWFRPIDPWMLIIVIPLLLFIYSWWQATNYKLMAVSAIIYWVSLTAIVYPRMGINAMPEGIPETIRGEYTVLYAGPQPAMLPAALGKGLRATSRLWTLPSPVVENCRGFLLFMPENMLKMASKQMSDLDLGYSMLDRFKVLSSRGSWLYFTKEGTTLEDWKRAIRDHDVDSLGIDILLLRATPEHCSK